MRIKPVMILALFAVALVGAHAAAGEGGTWVGAGGRAIALDGGAETMFVSEGGEVFDLGELREGETRTFGRGAKATTVSRLGNQVKISRPNAGEEAALAVTCDVTRDGCRIVTFAHDPEKVAIVIEKERVCVNGEGDCGSLEIERLPAGARTVIHTVRCDGEGDCEKTEATDRARAFAFHTGSGEAGDVMILRTDGGGDRLTLRCPEGDATLRVSRDEAEGVFLCPKHSVPLERPAAGDVKRVRVKSAR